MEDSLPGAEAGRYPSAGASPMPARPCLRCRFLHRDLFLVFHRALRNAERLRIVSRFVLECLEGRGARQAGRATGG